MTIFRCDRWNVEHIGEHGMAPRDAEYLIAYPSRGYPGKSATGRLWSWVRRPTGGTRG
jgi:hypothetical protein